jgi:ankyrin repeat protein
MNKTDIIKGTEDNSLENPHYFPVNINDLQIVTNEKNTLSRILNCISIGGIQGLKLLKRIIDTNLEVDFNINCRCDYWTYPLHYSIIFREEEIALYLISIGADVNLLDEFNCSPLNYTVSKFTFKSNLKGRKRMNIELRKLLVTLLVKGADVSYKCPETKFFPHTDAYKSSYYYSYDMLKKSVDNILSNPYEFPIKFKILKEYCIAEENNGNILGDLITTIITSDESTVLEKLDEICKRGTEFIIHAADNHGQTMLHYAVKYKMKKLINRLICMEVDPSRCNRLGVTALDITSTFNPKEGKEIALLIINSIEDHYGDRNKNISKSSSKAFALIDNIRDNQESKISDFEKEDILDNNEIKKSKKQKKKESKKVSKKNKNNDKKIRFEELTLMKQEDLRLIERLKEQRLISFVEDFKIKYTYSYMIFCFYKIKENYIDIKIRIKEENRVIKLNDKLNTKKRKRMIKNFIKLMHVIKLKESFLRLKNNSNFKNKYINNTEFFFESEINGCLFTPLIDVM